MNRLLSTAAAVVITAVVTALVVVLTTGSGGVGEAEAANGPSLGKIVSEQKAINKRLKAAILRANRANKDTTANKNAIAGISTTAGAQGPQGPAGPPGAAGPPGPIAGVAAGGALSGTFPNPGIASGVVGPGQLGGIPAAFVTGDSVETTSGPIAQGVPWNEANNQGAFTSDPFDLHSDTTNPERLTVKQAGYYYAYATIAWEGDADGRRVLRLVHNRSGGSSSFDAQRDLGIASGNVQSGGRLLRMEVGDSVEVLVRQDSGNALDVDPNRFSLSYVAPLA